MNITHRKVVLWTDNELNLIRELYPRLGSLELSNILNRPRHSIVDKAYRLKVELINPKKRTFCIDCKKEITNSNGNGKRYASRSKSGLCRKCSAKRFNRNSFLNNHNGKLFNTEEIEIIKEGYYNLPQEELCKRLNRSWSSIIHKAKRMGLKRNKKFLAHQLENHPNWQGGKKFEPYSKDFNKIFKEAIRQRDNFSCIKCNLFQEEHIKLYKTRLHIHHIDYNKKITIPENCCALCTRCNSEVNFNRSSWIKFFQSLLSERYGYKYSLNNEIILEIKNESY